MGVTLTQIYVGSIILLTFIFCNVIGSIDVYVVIRVHRNTNFTDISVNFSSFVSVIRKKKENT